MAAIRSWEPDGDRGAVWGGVVGGVVGGLAVGTFLWWNARRKNRRIDDAPDEV
ncbi:MAG: hypothetical protein QM774_07560 [Gordonia sp. (in: high G+C Gram-positive bacteria)]|uniref:hypothetical protein n=1 Tax=Gordonia sp. (in: high G+C Gram-positive bacteria) TaxID=84139 RepID=UPI0039E4A1C7